MAHMTVPGQNAQGEHMPAYPDFHPRERMPSYSQFDAQPAAKDFIPPDPLEMRPGMYIPPEETAILTDMNPSLDDIMGWSQSDEEQQDTDEDEEDNEFDMEFDDPEGLPSLPPSQTPAEAPVLGEQQQFPPSFPSYESVPYTQRPQEPVAYPVLTRYEYEQQPGYKAPFNFINPSSLQLRSPNDDSIYSLANAPIMPQDDADNAAAAPSASELGEPMVSEPMVSEPMVSESMEPLDLSNEKTLRDLGLSMDMDFAFGDQRAESEPVEQFAMLASPRSSPGLGAPKNSPKPEVVKDDGLMTPTTPPTPTPTTTTATTPPPEQAELREPSESLAPYGAELRTPPSAKEDSSPAASLERVAQLDSPFDESSAAALSPPPEKPRKRAARRGPKPAVASHHGTNAHVCNMSFADGRECHRSFTRPYDLARHQETIHAPVRRTYKCDACGDKSKTFSRLDALSRHMRLKHSD